ncbi:MAG: alpha/beta hydrolase [Candidatus Paceibacterota bacterium]|jgi:pimeloyl-ACP methyl ester carboxylesterase
MQEKKIIINDVEINYKTAGEGKPLLIWHGWGGSSDSWVKVQDVLAQKGLQVISLDLPGFGKSSNPPQPWGTAEYLDLLLKFIQKIGLENFFLLGHSFGGGLSAKFTALYPQKVKALVIVGAAIFRGKKRLSPRQKIASAIAKLGSFFAKVPLAGKLYPMARRILYRFAGTSDYYKANEVMKKTFVKVNAEDLGECLPMIKAPSLVIWGRCDRSVPVQDAFEANKLISNSKIKIIEGGNHSPHLNQPELTSQLIAEFLSDLK